jgi:hypothetical protein
MALNPDPAKVDIFSVCHDSKLGTLANF